MTTGRAPQPQEIRQALPPFFRWGAFFCPLSRISYPLPTIIHQQLQHPYRAASTVTTSLPPNKKADQAHSPHLRFRYSAHTLLRSLTLRSYSCRPNAVCKPHISPCFPFYGN